MGQGSGWIANGGQRHSGERYRAGAATLVEVTQARAVSFQASSAVVSARYNLLFQGKLLDYYLGDLKPQDVRLD